MSKNVCRSCRPNSTGDQSGDINSYSPGAEVLGPSKINFSADNDFTLHLKFSGHELGSFSQMSIVVSRIWGHWS